MFFFMSLGCKLNHSVKSGSPKLCLWSNLHVQVLQSAPLSVWSLFGCHRSLCGSRCKLHICLGTERCKKDKTASYLAGEQIGVFWVLMSRMQLQFIREYAHKTLRDLIGTYDAAEKDGKDLKDTILQPPIVAKTQCPFVRPHQPNLNWDVRDVPCFSLLMGVGSLVQSTQKHGQATHCNRA